MATSPPARWSNRSPTTTYCRGGTDGRRPVSGRSRSGGDIATESRPSGRPNLGHDQVLRDFRLRDEHLASASRYREIILWFEHDLLDQLQILQILDRLAGAEFASTRLSMICINSYPGVDPFRGLGQLDPARWRHCSTGVGRDGPGS